MPLTREQLIAWAKEEADKAPFAYRARQGEKFEAVAAMLKEDAASLSRLRAWMAEYPNDKYTGTWWLAELDRIVTMSQAEAK